MKSPTPAEKATFQQILTGRQAELAALIAAEMSGNATVFAQLTAEGRSSVAAALAGALIEALGAVSADPLNALLAGALLPAERSFADTQRLFSLMRRATLNLLRPLMAAATPAVALLLEYLGELLDAARESEATRQIEQVQRQAEAQAAELRTALHRMEQSFQTSPMANIQADNRGVITRWNRAAEQIFGWSTAEAVGRNAIELLVPNLALEQVEQVVGALLSGQATNSRNINSTKDGRLITCQWYNAVLYNADGSVAGWLSQTEDITEELRVEQERAALQEQVILAQQAALRELSTPIIPIGEGVVAMPLIGSIDSARAQLVIETLLEGVASSRARSAILDITGVQVVDTQVANALLRAAQAVKLLGAQVIITGIRPEVAQTLVGLGLDLSGIKTLATLQAGIAHALAAATR